MESDQKVYLIYTRDGSSYLLGDAVETYLFGVMCVSGVHLTNEDTFWTSGRPVYIPVESINRVIEFDSHAAHKEAVKSFYDEKTKVG